MSLTMQRVHEIAKEFEPSAYSSLLGVNLRGLRGMYTHRIENGSGIAGRSRNWRIVALKNGVSTESVTTAQGLRRLLREWRAMESVLSEHGTFTKEMWDKLTPTSGDEKP